MHALLRRALGVAAGAAAVTATLVAPASGAGQADLDTAVRETMLAERGPAASAEFNVPVLAEPLVEPTRNDQGWAFGTTTIPAPAKEHAGPHTAIFVAHRDARGWQVELDGTAEFVQAVQQAPDGIVSDGEKQLFARNYENSRTAVADTGLGLPWAEGVSWWMGGGPHGDSGESRPYSSLDFNGGNGQVLSAGAGRVYKSCLRNGSGLVRVVHENGFSTTYYHMTGLTDLGDGQPVQYGDYLGRIDVGLPCGGSTTGPHVHFSLLRGDSHTPVDGHTIGGWTFHEGAQAYGGYGERNGTQVGTGGQVTNHGRGDGTPTGVVDAGQNSSVNVRSEPKLTAPVVEELPDGVVVRIKCTARGDAVDGVWGRTDLWNQRDGGGWISDGFLYTGSNDPIAPPC
ncbi:peptidoglycan DD-metalloendopeptidase family protein [Saccharopolyspora sp. NPDC000359]|uniref:peptidoglycan DD-metalloendopeptidase family protein n=1 Tax=Saccharopolyspora sp. NPDC000359 TaxID=3154251 RepID=UPI00332A538A